MKKLSLFIFLMLWLQTKVGACICMDDIFPDRFNENRAIFIGQLTEIKQMDSFPENNVNDWFRRVYKFKVLKKYISGVSTYYSDWTCVLDYPCNCCGFLSSCLVGDTVLVFAHVGEEKHRGPQFLYGSQCTAYKILSKTNHKLDEMDEPYRSLITHLTTLDSNEQKLVEDPKLWQIIEHAPDTFPPAEQTPFHFPWKAGLFLLSVLLNLFLVSKIYLNKKVKS